MAKIRFVDNFLTVYNFYFQMEQRQRNRNTYSIYYYSNKQKAVIIESNKIT